MQTGKQCWFPFSLSRKIKTSSALKLAIVRSGNLCSGTEHRFAPHLFVCCPPLPETSGDGELPFRGLRKDLWVKSQDITSLSPTLKKICIITILIKIVPMVNCQPIRKFAFDFIPSMNMIYMKKIQVLKDQRLGYQTSSSKLGWMPWLCLRWLKCVH